MLVDNEHDFGDTVYLKTDIDQLPRIVHALHVTIAEVMYVLIASTITSTHYAFELSTEKTIF